MLCLGMTATKKKCTNKVTQVNSYCRYHKNQIKNLANELNNENKEEKYEYLAKIAQESYDSYHNNKVNIDIHDEKNQIGNDPCSICLCDVDECDDCNLVCSHKHHVDCIKQLHEPYCPVCRLPLEFKTSKKINIDQIKDKSAKEKIIREKEQMQTNINLANELNNELNNVKEDELIEKVLQESILSAEIDEYEYLTKLTEESYYYAEKEDEALLQKIMKENIEINKHDWCEEDVKTLMKGKQRIIITLK